jgi:threonine dehydrogenase-like Zn-dependent dehydrogenase
MQGKASLPKSLTYQAAVLVAPQQIELHERQTPDLGSREALIAVHAAGVCGTDLAIHDGGYRVPLPLVLGHEWVGAVAEVGEEVERALVGQRVVGEINQHCRAMGRPHLCPACASGLWTHCLERTVTGIVGSDGAFAERIVVAAENLRVVPDAMPDEAAILIEPLAAALQTFAMRPLKSEETVVVLGCGRLGVLVALVAQTQNVSVLAVTRDREHAELAARLGIKARVEDAPQEIAAWVEKATRGLGADVVVEATGSPDGLALALDCVRPRGTIALKSTPGVAVEHFDLTRAVVDEVRLQGSRCGDFGEAIAFWERYRPPLERLVAAEYPLDRIEQAIARAHEPGKVLVRCMR